VVAALSSRFLAVIPLNSKCRGAARKEIPIAAAVILVIVKLRLWYNHLRQKYVMEVSIANFHREDGMYI
jgi:hypothetical protein